MRNMKNKTENQTSVYLPRETDRDNRIADFLIMTLQKYIGTERRDFTLHEKFDDDMGLDSLDVVEILLDIEDHFDMEISDEETSEWKDISNVLKTINEKLDEMGR